ncbi:uncharacterized protein NEMAJ01_1358 [Nematocida major]|uniref:uncharacterized protein n=1 Tax=Nematocida major TaxID=1912982 RepID=UPI0020085D20|nr:uncharacterized protein NEMAJ01_1358 [Nematocida major]KAH9386462.1 hypothetical protein NEMAJ01_1358 [Nematocida major]
MAKRAGKSESESMFANNFNDKVSFLKKTIHKPASVARPVSGDPSVLYNEETGALKVFKFPQGFGKAVKVARERRGLSQKELATKLSKPASTVSDLEKDMCKYDKNLFQKLEAVLEVKFPSSFARGK